LGDHIKKTEMSWVCRTCVVEYRCSQVSDE